MGSEINGLVVDDRVPGPRQAAEKAVWSAAVREWVAKRRPEVDAAISRRPTDTDGLMPCSRVKVWAAIPTRCGESCADMEDFAIWFCFLKKSDLYQSWNCFHRSTILAGGHGARRIPKLEVSLGTQRLTCFQLPPCAVSASDIRSRIRRGLPETNTLLLFVESYI